MCANVDWTFGTIFSCVFSVPSFSLLSSGFAEAKRQQMIFCSTFGRPCSASPCIILFKVAFILFIIPTGTGCAPARFRSFAPCIFALGELPFEIMYVQPHRGFKTGVLPSLLFKFPIIPFDFSGAGINLTLLCLSRLLSVAFPEAPLPPHFPTSPEALLAAIEAEIRQLSAPKPLH